VRVVRAPVSADLEAGFGLEPADTARTVERAIEAGAVGCNLEDYDPQRGGLLSIGAQCTRIRAVKAHCEALGVRFFLNARTDVMFKAVGDPQNRLEGTIERLRAYAAAGADGAFAPGVSDPAQIERIVRELDVPFNVLARAGSPSISELGRLGVARVSLGSWPARIAMGAARAAARELLEHGTYGFASGPVLSYEESNALFSAAS